jgi:hypothetical protein
LPFASIFLLPALSSALCQLRSFSLMVYLQPLPAAMASWRVMEEEVERLRVELVAKNQELADANEALVTANEVLDRLRDRAVILAGVPPGGEW